MKKIVLLGTLLLLVGAVQSQQLIALEYFIDNDPGHGQAKEVPMAATASLDVAFNLDLAGVGNGLHWLGIRAKDDNQTWGNTMLKLLYLDAPLQHNLARLEYFFDLDPGYGNGFQVPVTAAPSAGITFELITANLSPGLHNLFVRMANEAGIWGNTSRKLFYYDPATLSDVVQMEYFIDNDPGYGLGQPIAISPGPNVEQAFELNANNLAPGVHQLHVRARNNGGGWSMVSSKTFLYEGPVAVSNLITMEYFYDNDPGFGSGFPLPVTEGLGIDQAYTLDISSLDAGNHLVYFRVKDQQGKWSLVSHYPIRIFDTRLFVQGFYNVETHQNNQTHGPSGPFFTGMVSDTLSLSFRSAAPPYSQAFVKHGVELLQDGSCKTALTEFPADPYWIEVDHRNTINTWSSAPVILSTSPFTYDFTTSQASAYGNRLTEVEPGVYGIYSGDVNHNGIVDLMDVDATSNSAQTFSKGYLPHDVNGDGVCDALDLIVVDNNAAMGIQAANPQGD